MGKHFQKRLTLWVSIGRAAHTMWLGTTKQEAKEFEALRSKCTEVRIKLDGESCYHEADLSHYRRNSTLESPEINHWIFQKGLQRTNGSPNPSLAFGFNEKNGVHTFEYIGVPLCDVEQ